ncbi:MAG: hypothetical protein N4A54_03980 [Peptostreptococcaceae bacterium]|jgi:hypothetical protein|nr:hypothetical protein [Peptostreptococcaceae bacterium]
MDIPGKLIISGIIIIGILLIFVVGTENTIPAFAKNEFDNTCDSYFSVLIADGGLSDSKKDELKGKLEGLGLESIKINAPQNAEWGDEVKLEITGKYIYDSTNISSLTKEKEEKEITYTNTGRIFGIEN